MPKSRSPSRRAVCLTAVALTGGLFGVTRTRAATSFPQRNEFDERTNTEARQEPPRDDASSDRFDVYPGVVDRIVDETFVVILLEADGRVVDELVERRDELPPLSEGDHVIAILEGETLRCVFRVSGDETR
ncbi:hypothetical protein [Halovivax cerinus]|uniref:Uncharacterized protein n=1 Tax=Halovivax cerinus TaxID=1487865 RepID=A0ABD5NK38_9EURY|nr:hypothetical protein [Halovivax cerinus]